MKIQIPKGTFDVLPYGGESWQQSDLWQFVEKTFKLTAQEYGYKEIRTPIFEHTELFDRGVGQSSDIVMKEMFTFEDRSHRLLSLRPEGTASVARAIVDNQLTQKGFVHKFYYLGPMFRYERPQSGRYRQHHQFGVECYGIGSPYQDAEMIDLLLECYNRIGLKNLKVQVNTVGDLESRTRFREALINFLQPHFSSLSPESKLRFEKNPMRILDSKDLNDKEIIKQAPSIYDYLSDSSKKHFNTVCICLDKANIPFEKNDKIVRGLDYYNQTVFEVLAENIGAQNTIGAGGRYDGLLQIFDGPNLPSVGFATGIERVLQVLIEQSPPLPKTKSPLLSLIPMGEESKEFVFELGTKLRHQKFSVEIEWNTKKISNSISSASEKGIEYICIIGSNEISSGKVKLKNLSTREEKEIFIKDLSQELQLISKNP